MTIFVMSAWSVLASVGFLSGSASTWGMLGMVSTRTKKAFLWWSALFFVGGMLAAASIMLVAMFGTFLTPLTFIPPLASLAGTLFVLIVKRFVPLIKVRIG